jgi:hypothetical protein
MRYIFELNHPKHYYQFKYVMGMLKEHGHDVLVVARDKDVLLDVLKEENVSYEIFGLHRKSMVEKVFGTFSIIRNYMRIVKRYQPDVMVSKASYYGCHCAKRFGCKSAIFPDSEVVAVTNKYVVPLATIVVTPNTFGLDYGKKHVRIKGLFEDCYLAPSVFSPNAEVVEQYGLEKPYAVFRFVGWFANHDVNNSGFTLEEKKQLVNAVLPFMHVYLSSENEMPEDLEKYKLQTPASMIHSVLSEADLYLGDSQTMATEAALLGTPAIRSNSFVGPNDMTNFKVLENTYGLLRNIKEYDEVLSVVTDFAQNSRKEEWKSKRRSYYEKVGDSNEAIVRLLEGLE